MHNFEKEVKSNEKLLEFLKEVQEENTSSIFNTAVQKSKSLSGFVSEKKTKKKERSKERKAKKMEIKKYKKEHP